MAIKVVVDEGPRPDEAETPLSPQISPQNRDADTSPSTLFTAIEMTREDLIAEVSKTDFVDSRRPKT